jgi:MFS transporter, FLVCR family, MFS-domain-containing protein 7
LLIVVGLVTAAITSPIVDRTHAYVLGIRILVPILAICYLAFIWAPGAGGLPAPYVLASVLGAASFALVPIALEYGVEMTFPLSPEVGSTIFWAGGQLLGGIFIVIMNALKGGVEGEPPQTMKRSLIFEAILACLVAPLPLVLGSRRLGLHVEGRWHMDRDDRQYHQ